MGSGNLGNRREETGERTSAFQMALKICGHSLEAILATLESAGTYSRHRKQMANRSRASSFFFIKQVFVENGVKSNGIDLWLWDQH